MTSTQPQNKYEEYKKKALDRIEAILNKLNVQYKMNPTTVELLCPIHNSDTLGNSIIYLNTGVWICFSGGCHNIYGKTILDFISGVLAITKEKVVFKDVMDMIDGIGEVKPLLIKEKNVNIFKDEASKPVCSIPSRYFLAKGYSEEVLRSYEVGDCHTGIYAQRAVAPVRYINGEYMGFTARSHWAACKRCSFHHSKYDPCIKKDQEYHFMYKKWIHSKGLIKSKTLYGIHKFKTQNNLYAAGHSSSNAGKRIALVEGPACVWRLSSYSILGVASLGKDFNKTQAQMLRDLGIDTILFIPDNDEAGQEYKQRFIATYHKDFNIHIPTLTKKDVGEMSDEDIKKHILSKWEKI